MFRRFLVMSSVALASLLAGSAAQAVPAVLNLSKTPLFINASVDPNLLVTFDDSGSMAYAYVPDNVNDKPCFFRYRSFYSAAHNKIYYDPNITYTPPIDGNGTSLGNQSYTNASTNGFVSTAPKVNLSTAYAPSVDISLGTPNVAWNSSATSQTSCGTQNYKFPITPTSSAQGFYCVATVPPPSPVDFTTGSTYYTWFTTDSNFTCQAVGAAEQTNFANWYAYYRYRSNALKSALSRAMGVIDDDIRVAWQNMNTNAITATTSIDRFSGTLRSNFFTWLFAAPISGNTPTLTSTIRVGSFFQRATGSATTNPYWDSTLGKELSCRQNYHVLVTDGYWNQSTQPTLSGANDIVRKARTLPDGKAFGITDKVSRVVWAQRDPGSNCSSGLCVPSYSDVSFFYWANDLRPDLTNNVVPYLPDRTTGVTGAAVDISTVTDLLSVPEIYWNPNNDPATWQHVDQFFIGFGIAGKLPLNDNELRLLRTGDGPPDTPAEFWSGPLNNSPESVDDSWHATMVSRGKTFGTTDPNAIVDALTDVLSAIVARKGSSASVSVATGIVTGTTFTYQTVYDSTDASGTVLARKLNANFSFDPRVEWDTSCILTGGVCPTNGNTYAGVNPNSRNILTSSATGAGKGVPFRWNSLSSTEQALLNKNPQTAATDSLGPDRVDFVRGVRSKEKQFGGSFRNRNFVMGAVVDSSAEYVGAPRELYELGPTPAEADSYKAFKLANKDRPGVIYVGANDGMLHAFNGNTGDELFAYVPYAVYARLNQLTNPLYTFENYVDNTPTIRDIYLNGRWRTVLVGTLRRGGQGVFALDITDTPSEGTAGASVLWDLTDANDSDLGYTYGRPVISRLDNGKFVALLPAGYNSQEADGVTGSGASVLFVIDMSNGSVLRKFNLTTETGGDPASTGLASPIATDPDSDFSAEYAYAGDLNGNIWKFDLTSNSPTSWSFSRLFKPTTPFDRPITAQPRALRHPTLGYPIILVGTGKFIELNDRSSAIPTQAFYGIFDQGVLVNQSELTSLSIIPGSKAGVRSLTAPNPIQPPKGWQILLNDASAPGERVIAPATVRIDNNEVIFATLVSAVSDPCVPNGSSYLMFVSALNGYKPADGDAFFDSNGDGKIDDADSKTDFGQLVSSLVPGVASVVQQGGGIGGILVPPAVGGAASTGQSIKFRVSEWRRHSWREKYIRQ